MRDDGDRDGDERKTLEMEAVGALAPLAPRSGQLTVTGGPMSGRKFALGDGSSVIGRGPGVTVSLDDPRVSRAHARIRKEHGGRFRIDDGPSRYGTFVNGERVAQALLGAGDRIVVGHTVLCFDYRDPEADRALEREQLEMVGRLGAAMVHDMNSLLSVSLACAESLRILLSEIPETPGARAEAAECIESIVTATQRGGDLTSHLVRLARREPIQTGDVDLSALVNETLDLARHTMPRQIEIVREVVEGLHVTGNRSELHRALMNLLLNARDAMQEAGKLEVSLVPVRDSVSPASGGEDAETKAPVVRLTVRDSGIGMDEETRARIFEPLFTTKASGKGTGLGLAAVAQIAASHGGRIACRSTPKVGTAMEMILPRAAAPGTGSRPTHVPVARKG